MRILITVPHLSNTGGVANYYRTIKPYYTANVNYHVVGTATCQGRRTPRLLQLLRDYVSLRRALVTGRYDIVHVNPSLNAQAVLRDGASLLLAQRLGHRTVVFFRGWSDSFEAAIQKHWLGLFRRVYFRADCIVVLARQFEATLRRWGYTGHLVCETTVSHEDIAGHGCLVASRADRPSDSCGLLVMSRIEATKGILTSIRAFEILKRRFPHLTLTIAGTGSGLPDAEAFVTQRAIEDVHFVGYLRGQDKAQALHAADIFVLPSTREGMPNSVLDAMAHGLPIVTRYVGGLRDFFESGLMGFATESTDPEVFVELIERLLLEPALRLKIGQFNQRYAREHFSPAVVAHRMESLYHQLLRGARPNGMSYR